MSATPSRGVVSSVAAVLVRRAGGFALLLAATAVGARGAQAPDAPAARLEPDSTRPIPPELAARLRNDPYAYFRVVNRPWAGRVCAAFREELPALARVRLHGDAHLEQYAFTAVAHGLDDFDDATEGPSVVDLVRFLGSVHLAARSRGWTEQADALFDEFFRGYRAGLRDPAYAPNTPTAVRRLRGKGGRGRKQFLEWAESLMRPVSDQEAKEAQESLVLVASLFDTVRPALPRGYFVVKKIGELRMGLGSVLTPKLLVRIEGASLAEDDDVVLEGKELSHLAGADCLDVPRAGEVFRVISGAEQIGRIRHEVLSVIPKREADAPEAREWWLRSWDANYGEVGIDDLATVAELKEVVHDVGAQLGTTNVREQSPLLEAQLRQREIAESGRLEPRIRLLARQLAAELLEEWTAFRQRTEATP